MSHIVAISNNKGGVAKTTTCISLGACLAELGHRTLIVDMDPQADLTLAAGLDADELEWSLADLLEPDRNPTSADVKRAIQPTQVEALDILPTDPRMAGVERLLYEHNGYETILARMLAPWHDEYEYILLDCAPSLGGITLTALTAARWVLIPVQCEYFAARRMRRLLEAVTIVRKRTNPHLTCYLVATMYDKRNRICQGVLQQLRWHFPTQLLDTVIGVDTRLRESPATGEPITLYAPRTRASQQYRQLAREFLAKLENTLRAAQGD
ncbi:MAG: ParA family protein [Chloroflexi bacterium]|nr:ParA family protein [Chloroflexota bacterium]